MVEALQCQKLDKATGNWIDVDKHGNPIPPTEGDAAAEKNAAGEFSKAPARASPPSTSIQGFAARIPINPTVNLAPLEDADSIRVLALVKFGEQFPSSSGWIYEKAAMEEIVAEIMSEGGAPAFAGHQAPGAEAFEFRPLVGAWFGAAILDDGTMGLLGIITDPILARFIRSGVVSATSIWGYPATEVVSGVVHVVGYSLVSNDIVPPGRAGMAVNMTALDSNRVEV